MQNLSNKGCKKKSKRVSYKGITARCQRSEVGSFPTIRSNKKMNMKSSEEKEEFYANCSSILGIPHVFRDPVTRRTRWNTRFLGNGRYPGFGLVQCFGSSIRVVSKNGTKIFYSYEEVYDYLNKVIDNANSEV